MTNSFGAKVGSQSVGAIPQLSSGAEYNGAVNNSDQFQLSNQNQFHKSTPAYVSDSNESITPAYVYENSASHGYNRSAWVTRSGSELYSLSLHIMTQHWCKSTMAREH